VRAVPRLCEFYPVICLTTEEKSRKNVSHGSRRVTVNIFTTLHSPFFYATLARVYWEKPRKIWVCRRRSDPGTTWMRRRNTEISIVMSGEREGLSSVNALSVHFRRAELRAGHMYHFYAHKILHFSRAETFRSACTTYNPREGSDINIFLPVLWYSNLLRKIC